MKKFLICVAFSALSVFAGKSPFSIARTVSLDSNGQPSEEAIDLTICIDREPVAGNPNDPNSRERYENIIKYWADGLYEMSNGGNYLGNIRIFTGGKLYKGCDVFWRENGVWPNAYVGYFNSEASYGINVSDEWAEPQKHDYRASDKRQFEFGMTLTHESMHYLYGLLDEYGTDSIKPTSVGTIKVYADPETDMVHIDEFYTGTKEASLLDVISKGQHVFFFPLNGGVVPWGLRNKPYYEWDGNQYAMVDEVVWAPDGSPSLSFNLMNSSGERVDIKDSGSGMWGVALPPEAGSSAHSVQNTQWPLSYFKYGDCSAPEIPWQWANLSTEFTSLPASKQRLYYKNSDGKSFSGWEVVVRDPVNDAVYKKSASKTNRFWFKSLINRAPTVNDSFATVTHYANYDEATGRWQEGDATWNSKWYCGTKNVVLPYMKVELAGKTEEEYIKETRKHLNIMWVGGMKVEVIVVLDHSGSMTLHQKMEQAKLASKYVATGFLGSGSGYSAQNVSVGIYSFNHKVTEVYAPRYNPKKDDILSAVDPISANGQTALFDALDAALGAFSDDPSSIKLLYVVSDGLDNMSEKTQQEIVNLYKSKNVAIHTFAYGGDADVDLLATMASETGGTFFNQQEDLVLKVNAAVATVLSNTVGTEQIASSSLKPSAQSSEIYFPPQAGRVRIYGSYEGKIQRKPMVLVSGEGANVKFTEKVFPMGNLNYFIADVDSATLAGISSSKIKVKNNMAAQNLEFRALVSETRPAYSMSVGMQPEAPYVWPQQASFTASVSSRDGALADVVAKGKLTYPDGNVKAFDLYDDGTHGDDLAGDGMYFGYMPDVQSNGTYQWEISISNKKGKAHTSHIGTTLPDSIEVTEVDDTAPFEFIRNGQFVVNTCCSENDDEVKTIQPEVHAYGFLNEGYDVDKFRIVGTKSDKVYSLVLESTDLSAFDKVEVFSPQDLNTPLYSTAINAGLNNQAIVSLSADYAVPGYIVAVSGDNAAGVNYSLLLLESNDALFAVGRFESLSDWHTDYSPISLDSSIRSEGMSSLKTIAGWKAIESRNVSTSDFKQIGDKMSLDVYVPATSLNQHWLGTLELWVNVPSANKRIQLGSPVSIQPLFNAWMTYVFDVPEQVKTLLSEQHSDLRFQITLNSADVVWIDNLRFSGRLEENHVGKFVAKCPDAVGCSAANPIQLSVGNSVEVYSAGEVWIEVVDFPEEWTPMNLDLDMFALDGEKLAGSLEFLNTSYSLTDWGFAKQVRYDRNRRYLLKLYNTEGRLYRLSAWVSGQSMDIALANNMFGWNVKF